MIWNQNILWDLAMELFHHQCNFNLIGDSKTHLNHLKKHSGFSNLSKGNWKLAFQNFIECTSIDILHTFEIVHLFFDSEEYFHEQFEFLGDEMKFFQYSEKLHQLISEKGKFSSIDYFCKINGKSSKERLISEFYLFQFLNKRRKNILNSIFSEQKFEFELRIIDSYLLILLVHFRKKKIYLFKEIDEIRQHFTKESIDYILKQLLKEKNFIHEKDLIQFYHYLLNENLEKYAAYLLWNKGHHHKFHNLKSPFDLLLDSSEFSILEEFLCEIHSEDQIFKYSQNIIENGKFTIDSLNIFTSSKRDIIIQPEKVINFLKKNFDEFVFPIYELEYLYLVSSSNHIDKITNGKDYLMNFMTNCIKFLFHSYPKTLLNFKFFSNQEGIGFCGEIRRKLKFILSKSYLSKYQKEQILESLKLTHLFDEGILIYKSVKNENQKNSNNF